MNAKAQGALEYLLLIGGAVLIAAIVLTLLTTLGNQSSSATEKKVTAAQCAGLPVEKCDSVAWTDFTSDGVADCGWNVDALNADGSNGSCEPA